MSKQIEAMKLALEALQTAHLAVEDDMLADEIQQAITAIREALAEQPAQTATYTCGDCSVSMQMEVGGLDGMANINGMPVPLPMKIRPLKGEEYWTRNGTKCSWHGTTHDESHFSNGIWSTKNEVDRLEYAVRVALNKAKWEASGLKPCYWKGYGDRVYKEKPFDGALALYAGPSIPKPCGGTGYVPAQPSKSLTDEQIREASLQAGMQEHYMDFHSGFIRFARAIEAKLKEKNT